MPGEIVGELILRPLFELFLQLIGYFTSRLLTPILSFGYMTVAPADKGVKVRPKWHEFNKASNGKIVLNEEMGALLGVIFWVVAIITGFFIHDTINT